MAKVFIGVGHGGKDSGAVAGGLRESDVNLTMALAMRDELRRHGVTVGISRTTDEDDRLSEEIQECNAFAPDFAVEVHNNSGGGDGFEVFVYPGSGQARRLAEAIEDEVKGIGQNSRGIKTSTALGWVREVKAPAVLCEGFFLDNATDRLIADTAAKQRAFGAAYARGVLRMLGIAYIPQGGDLDVLCAQVKARYGFDDDTMQELRKHPYPDALMKKLADKPRPAGGGIGVNGEAVQQIFGFENETMRFLMNHQYSDALFVKMIEK
ncbi:N-acetylmuramoyl-L-alanine amidase [Intestinibacillus massiliensis]|uniref:N-acetylmuramoyl-L-alanine amidase n=1 Tax=Intestinibacillus massiliensis TaxID=1871029 RepID=UPI000B36478C|nr:N-acetylmuramoyl-L-alanine amidase [Intestinibacillus massiliensis]